MAITDAEQIGEGPCTCGRILRKPHCPACGTYDVYARGSKKDVIKIDPHTGERRRVVTFRCRKCGMYYDRDQWLTACNAPQYVTREIRRREQEMVTREELEQKLGRQMVEALNEIKTKQGMQPAPLPPRASDVMFSEADPHNEEKED